MPFVTLPDRGMHMHYLVNPAWPYVRAPGVSAAPMSRELNPALPNLILIHASTMQAAIFFSQFNDSRLQASFNLISFDSRFHGWTAAAAIEHSTYETCADDLLAAIDKLGLTKYSLFGESHFGVGQAMWIAIKRPQQVQGMVFASPCGIVEKQGVYDGFQKQWFLPYDARKTPESPSGIIPEDLLKARQEYFFGSLERDVERRAVFDLTFQLRYGPGHDSEDIRHVMMWYNRPEIDNTLLDAIVCPVLILQGGSEDNASLYSDACWWKNNLRSVRGGAELQVIASGPHLLSYTESSCGVVNRFVAAFLKKTLQAEAEAGAMP